MVHTDTVVVIDDEESERCSTAGGNASAPTQSQCPASSATAARSVVPNCSGTGKGKGKAEGQQVYKEQRAGKEKRLRRFISRASHDVEQRISRALQQRLYLIERKPQTSQLEQEFVVLGNTGNVYEVYIGQLPRCSCPDNQKGNRCKHLLFVLLRVLKVKQDDPILWQNALLESELQQILRTSDVSSSVLAEAAVRQKYQAVTGGSTEEKEAAGPRRKAIEGDCPICFEPLMAAEEVMWCQAGCGNNLHQDCFRNWARMCATGASPCPLCRTPLTLGGEAKQAAEAGASRGGGGYTNLGDLSTAHRRAQVGGEYPEENAWESRGLYQPWKRRRGGRRW